MTEKKKDLVKSQRSLFRKHNHYGGKVLYQENKMHNTAWFTIWTTLFLEFRVSRPQEFGL